jgi:hypothetical protein
VFVEVRDRLLQGLGDPVDHDDKAEAPCSQVLRDLRLEGFLIEPLPGDIRNGTG